MYCKNCGFKNEDSAAFCTNCGAGLEIEAGTSVLYEEAQNYQQEQYVDIQSSYSTPTYNNEYYSNSNEYYSTPVYNAYDTVSNEPQTKVNKTSGILSIIFGALGIALSVGGCCCFILGVVLGSIVIIVLDIIALVLGITGIILAASGRKKAKAAGVKNGLATAGLIVSIVATVISAPSIILFGLVTAGVLVGGVAGMGALSGMDGYYYY